MRLRLILSLVVYAVLFGQATMQAVESTDQAEESAEPAGIGGPGASGGADTARRPYAKVQPVALHEVHWTSGFWADRFATCRDNSVPAMWELMKGTQYKPFYQNFLIAAGSREGEHHGAAWNDGDFYKWIEAACSIYAVTGEPELKRHIDQSISAIGQAQREDGYLHTPVLIRQRNGDATARPFQDPRHFEMYNMGHLITAACLHYRVTGEPSFLKIARKTADFLDRTFRDPTPELARNAVCPSHYMAIVELYRTTHEPRYLNLAEKFFAIRALVSGGGDDNQDRIPFAEQREAVGHAVRANYLYAGAADLFMETGDRRLWIPLEAIWENVTTKKMYITGGCGALYDGASPDGSRDQSQITRVHQAYGRNYQLPNITAHNETCATIGNVLWNWRMFMASGEARFVDILELALYNGVLSGVSLEGTDYFYVNPLRTVDPLPSKLRWSRTRVPFVTSYCCPPNVARTVAQINRYAYAKTGDAVLVNLYGGSKLSTRLSHQPLRLTQTTDYPWDGRIRITIDECPARDFALQLRVPGWAESAHIRVNGETVDTRLAPSSFAELRRTWKPGDVVQIDFPMPAQLIESHPLVEETRNQVAIQRGPVVYCLESCDLPQEIRVGQIAISPETRFTAQSEPQTLGGVTLLVADVWRRSAEDWSSRLYRPLRQRERSKVRVRFIPYYAWSNRGKSEMSVWLPLAED